MRLCACTELRCGGSRLRNPTRHWRVMSAGVLREIGIRPSNLPQTRFARMIRVSNSIFGRHFAGLNLGLSNSAWRSSKDLHAF